MPPWSYSLKTTTHTVAIAVHLFFSLLVIVLSFVSCVQRSRPKHKYFTFYGHSCTWILSLALLVVVIFEVLEGILSDVKTASLNLDVHICNVAAVLASTLVLVLYNLAENQCCAVYLFLIFLYWLFSGATAIAELFAVLDDSYNSEGSAKLLLVCFVVCIYFLLLVVNVLIHIKKVLRRHPVGRFPAEIGANLTDKSSVKFVHSYVSFLSKTLIHWFNPILLTGYRKCLTIDDLGHIPKSDSGYVNFKKLKNLFEEEKKNSFHGNKSASLLHCFWLMTKPMMILSGFFKIVSDLLIYIPPICVDVIVGYLLHEVPAKHDLTTPVPPLSIREFFINGYVISVICFVILMLQMTLFQHHLFISVREGIRVKGALQGLVFDKSLRLFVPSINKGNLMNHMTVDPLHVVMLFTFIHSIWTMPVQVLVGLVMLYLQLGTSALIGGILILFMVFVQYHIGGRLGVTQEKIMEQADERLKQSGEMLQSIKLLKLYSWEKVFYESVCVTRAKELRLMLTASLLRVVSIAVTDGVPYMACLLTFVLYHYIESEPLHPGKVFSGLTLFAIFNGQLFIITLMINVAIQAKISVMRLRDFLLLPEIPMKQLPENDESLPPADDHDLDEEDEKEIVLKPLQTISASPPPVESSTIDQRANNVNVNSSNFMIEILGGNFSATEKQILFDITIHILTGKLTLVIGPVGSGKSSLLWAILGEMYRLSGLVVCRSHSIAFVPQQSWIMNATVRDNITFGLPYDKDKYQIIIEASGLEPDFLAFPAGDQTEIGEKGANLSGGQKQRVSIARALYSDADIYLMDDPLSALDPVVGSQIFENAVKKYLLGNRKTVVLVTHHIQLAPFADHLIMMKNGRVFYKGHANEFLKNSVSYTAFDDVGRMGSDHSLTDMPNRDKEIALHHTPSTPVGAGIKAALSFTTLRILSDDIDLEYETSKVQNQTTAKEQMPLMEIGRLTEEEKLSSGAISIKYFIAYFRAASWLLTISALSCYSIRMAVRMVGDYWLTKLIDASIITKSRNLTNDISDSEVHDVLSHGMDYYIIVYVILSVVAILLVPFGTLFLELMVLTASKRLHNRVLEQVVSAPLRFFDMNPIGRIINRLAADMNVIDEKLAIIFDALLFCMLSVLGGVLLNCAFVPYFIIAIVPILVCFVFVQRFCIASCRELQRLDCSTKSPILAQFSQMLDGLATIRAYKSQERFLSEIFKKIDENNVVFLFFNTCHLWLGLRLDYLGSLLVLCACISSILTCVKGVISAATVGLITSYAIMICSLLNWTMRYLSEMEVYFGSVERLIQYTTITSEPYEESKGPKPPVNWPSEGKIEFQNISLQFSAELDPVVQNFTLLIKPGMKVGICGRTGSGKSSLMLSLFRMISISNGRVFIDDIDITDVPLTILRSRLSIIPQDPVLFSGTVRFNLDPLNEKTEDDIWQVLEICQLKDLVSSFPDKLETAVSEGGDNFSIGQRQLFCLGRALLRNSKVLIMDEATASVDRATDKMIQDIVKKAFEHSTVVMIAHRLSTIKDCDLVVVLRDGQMIEEGDPVALVKQGGAFAQMLAENQL